MRSSRYVKLVSKNTERLEIVIEAIQNLAMECLDSKANSRYHSTYRICLMPLFKRAYAATQWN